MFNSKKKKLIREKAGEKESRMVGEGQGDAMKDRGGGRWGCTKKNGGLGPHKEAVHLETGSKEMETPDREERYEGVLSGVTSGSGVDNRKGIALRKKEKGHKWKEGGGAEVENGHHIGN